MGRHRADSEDRQRHDDGPRLTAPQPSPLTDNAAADGAGGVSGGVSGEVSGDSVKEAVPAVAEPELRPRRNSGGRAVPAGAKLQAPKPSPRNNDLLGWGLFLAVTAAGTMIWAGIAWPVTAACGFLLLLSFAAVWYVSSSSPASAKTPDTPAVPRESSPEPAGEAPSAVVPAAALTPAVISPAAVSPAGPSTAAPMTRKQMRAADPTTGVLPVVSVFARKPAAASGPAPARTTSSPPEVSAVPRAPAGQVLQGIDSGTALPESRRARRAAGAGTGSGTGSSADTGSTVDSSTPEGPVESRWTRVFGPPETGQLPVQRYVAAASALDAAGTSAERQQRSHSSL